MKLRWCFLFAMALSVMAAGCNPGGDKGETGTITGKEPAASPESASATSVPDDLTIRIQPSGYGVDVVPREFHVERGQTFRWVNETKESLSIENGSGPELFGRFRPFMVGGGSAVFTVFDDGDTTRVEYEYEIRNKTTDPPPKIIVCPPGGCP